jgi:excisionase family DNA binding protein
MNQPVQRMEKPEAERELFSIRDLCNKTGLSYRTLFRRVREGKIQSVKFGPSILIPKREFERVLAKGF